MDEGFNNRSGRTSTFFSEQYYKMLRIFGHNGGSFSGRRFGSIQHADPLYVQAVLRRRI